MLTLTPQYITNRIGKKTSVILPLTQFEKLLAELEEAEDVKLYDEVKKANEERTSLDDYLAQRKKRKHAKV
ncbi:MAG: hypothetical protein RL708_1995 [Bacteroidota bacterium]|jgi:hypothetical protein